MKTNVTMIRKMGNFDVAQRTKDGMFNATALLKQWNAHTDSKKELKEFFDNKATKEFIDVIKAENNILHRDNCPYVKSKASRGENAGTWMHPYLFIDFAMWINPSFKLKVIQFVYDQLLENRNTAGDLYCTLSNTAKQLKGVDYKRIGKGLNYIIFGYHESGILRQKATQEQLNELSDIQKKLAFAIDMGYIANFDQLINEMKRLFNAKWNLKKL